MDARAALRENSEVALDEQSCFDVAILSLAYKTPMGGTTAVVNSPPPKKTICADACVLSLGATGSRKEPVSLW